MSVKYFLLVILSLLLTSCATKVVSIYNYDAAKSKPTTYLLRASETDSLSDDKKKLDDELFAVIKEGLAQKGLKPSALPDLYISYIINVHTSSECRVH